MAGLTDEQLNIAKNELYARHGRKFTNKELQAYFDAQPWYTGTIEPDDFKEDQLFSSTEKKNAEFLSQAEKARGINR